MLGGRVLLAIMFGCEVIQIQAAAVGDAGGAALEQRTRSFTIALEGSVAEVTPLFGPVREREWAPSWRPHFLHPRQGSQREGVVFTTTAANRKEGLWLLTRYDIEEGRVEYVFVVPGFTANEIKIHVSSDGARRCKATITCRHSALAADGNDEVKKLDDRWAEQQRVHWEAAINSLLAKGSVHE
jgi:hypothetical protein